MVVFGNGALRAQYYILTLQRMFKSTSSGYRVDKLGFVSCIRPLKIFCRSLGHIGPVVLDKTLKYRKIIMQICLPIGKKPDFSVFRCFFLNHWTDLVQILTEQFESSNTTNKVSILRPDGC